MKNSSDIKFQSSKKERKINDLGHEWTTVQIFKNIKYKIIIKGKKIYRCEISWKFLRINGLKLENSYISEYKGLTSDFMWNNMLFNSIYYLQKQKAGKISTVVSWKRRYSFLSRVYYLNLKTYWKLNYFLTVIC